MTEISKKSATLGQLKRVMDHGDSRIDELKGDLADKLDNPDESPKEGRILKVKKVNADGSFLCEWSETAGANEWKRLVDFVTEEETSFIEIPVNVDGYKEILVYMRKDDANFFVPDQIQFAYGDPPYYTGNAIGLLTGGISAKLYCGRLELIANSDDGTMEVFNTMAYKGTSVLGGTPNDCRQVIGKYVYDFSKTTKILFSGNGLGIATSNPMAAGVRIAIFAR